MPAINQYFLPVNYGNALETKPKIITKAFARLPVEVLRFHDGQPLDAPNLISPNRNGYFQIIFVTKGTCSCKVDFDQYEVNTRNLGFIRPGQIIQLAPALDAQGYILRFTPNYLNTSVERSLMINQVTIQGFTCLPDLDIYENDKSDITPIIDNIFKEYSSLIGLNSHSFSLEVISGLLKVLLIYISKIVSSQRVTKYADRIEVVEKFFTLLEERFKTSKSVAYYAALLKVSPGYLNEVLKKTTGFTTTHHIAQRVIVEVKRMTVYSDSNMKQIGYELGFEDMAHFSKFFKRVSGENYSEYRKTLNVV